MWTQGHVPTRGYGLCEAGAGERHLHRSRLCLSRVLLHELLRAEHHGRTPPRAVHKPPEVLDCLRGCGRLPGECSVTHHSRFLILSRDQPALLRSRPEQEQLLRYRRGPASHHPIRLHARRQGPRAYGAPVLAQKGPGRAGCHVPLLQRPLATDTRVPGNLSRAGVLLGQGGRCRLLQADGPLRPRGVAGGGGPIPTGSRVPGRHSLQHGFGRVEGYPEAVITARGQLCG
mmetsp:Transcript_75820/g.181381  ORF Transcript_75820/g.181381 Transcript_75820/m.181381 type:complete len:230 (+) Transcript_75820:1485-2174(+)